MAEVKNLKMTVVPIGQGDAIDAEILRQVLEIKKELEELKSLIEMKI